jgi:gluconolactonase
VLLGLALLAACSKSTKVGSQHEEPAPADESDQDDSPASDEPADSPASDQDGADEADDSKGDAPAPPKNACMPASDDDSDSDGDSDDESEPSGSVNGGLDPLSFARLEAAQLGTPKLVADTFTLAEGPVWDPCTKQLLFTDVEAQKIHTLSHDGAIGVYYEPSNYANGLAFDAQGRLMLAEMGGGQGGRITRLDRALNLEVLIDHDPACGKLNTSDDLAVRSDGTIYFSDPVIAHGNYLGFSLTAKPIYRLAPGSGERMLVKEGQASLPNGVRLSPDEHTLYVVGYLEGRVRRFDVAADGSLSESAPLATGLSTPDSLCVDAAGNVYVGVSRGLSVLRPDGSAVALIPIPSSSGTTNCAFGGEDGKTLFITAWTSLWQLDAMPIPGNDWARNRDMPCEP